MYLELIRLKKYRTRNRLSTNRWYCGGPLRLYKKCHRGNLNFDKNSRNVLELHREEDVQKWLYLGCFWWNCWLCCWPWWTVERRLRTIRSVDPWIEKLVKINGVQMHCMNLTLEFSFWNLEKFILWSTRTKVSRTIVLLVLKSYLNRFMVSISGINPKLESWFMG